MWRTWTSRPAARRGGELQKDVAAAIAGRQPRRPGGRPGRRGRAGRPGPRSPARWWPRPRSRASRSVSASPRSRAVPTLDEHRGEGFVGGLKTGATGCCYGPPTMTRIADLLSANQAYAAARANVADPTTEPALGPGDLHGRAHRRLRALRSGPGRGPCDPQRRGAGDRRRPAQPGSLERGTRGRHRRRDAAHRLRARRRDRRRAAAARTGADWASSPSMITADALARGRRPVGGHAVPRLGSSSSPACSTTSRAASSRTSGVGNDRAEARGAAARARPRTRVTVRLTMETMSCPGPHTAL